MQNLKDTITNIMAFLAGAVAVVQLVLGVWNEFISTHPDPTTIDWLQLVILVAIAVIGYFTGKNPDGSKKKNPAVV